MGKTLIFLLTLILPLQATEELRANETKLFPFTRGKVPVYYYHPSSPPKAIVIFGSGDGGWSDFENTVCRWLADDGVLVAGIDLADYAKTDYDSATLGADYSALAESLLKEDTNGELPLIYSGWSMGGTQAIAASSWIGRPENLQALLILSADSRGRYGLRPKDKIGITPTGSGTFRVSDFTARVADFRVIQFHGGIDFMSSTAW